MPLCIVGSSIHKNRLWKCKCDCGKIVIKRSYYLTSGDTKSCGCLRRDLLTKHGMSRTRIYKTWEDIIRRCFNKHHHQFRYWGGRGITVCPSWMSFINFKNDMYPSYIIHCQKYGEKQTTIDRIDNDGNYKKSNCRWATYKIQIANRRGRKLSEV